MFHGQTDRQTIDEVETLSLKSQGDFASNIVFSSPALAKPYLKILSLESEFFKEKFDTSFHK